MTEDHDDDLTTWDTDEFGEAFSFEDSITYKTELNSDAQCVMPFLGHQGTYLNNTTGIGGGFVAPQHQQQVLASPTSYHSIPTPSSLGSVGGMHGLNVLTNQQSSHFSHQFSPSYLPGHMPGLMAGGGIGVGGLSGNLPEWPGGYPTFAQPPQRYPGIPPQVPWLTQQSPPQSQMSASDSPGLASTPPPHAIATGGDETEVGGERKRRKPATKKLTEEEKKEKNRQACKETRKRKAEELEDLKHQIKRQQMKIYDLQKENEKIPILEQAVRNLLEEKHKLQDFKEFYAWFEAKKLLGQAHDQSVCVYKQFLLTHQLQEVQRARVQLEQNNNQSHHNPHMLPPHLQRHASQGQLQPQQHAQQHGQQQPQQSTQYSAQLSQQAQQSQTHQSQPRTAQSQSSQSQTQSQSQSPQYQPEQQSRIQQQQPLDRGSGVSGVSGRVPHAKGIGQVLAAVSLMCVVVLFISNTQHQQHKNYQSDINGGQTFKLKTTSFPEWRMGQLKSSNILQDRRQSMANGSDAEVYGRGYGKEEGMSPRTRWTPQQLGMGMRRLLSIPSSKRREGKVNLMEDQVEQVDGMWEQTNQSTNVSNENGNQQDTTPINYVTPKVQTQTQIDGQIETGREIEELSGFIAFPLAQARSWMNPAMLGGLKNQLAQRDQENITNDEIVPSDENLTPSPLNEGDDKALDIPSFSDLTTRDLTPRWPPLAFTGIDQFVDEEMVLPITTTTNVMISPPIVPVKHCDDLTEIVAPSNVRFSVHRTDTEPMELQDILGSLTRLETSAPAVAALFVGTDAARKSV